MSWIFAENFFFWERKFFFIKKKGIRQMWLCYTNISYPFSTKKIFSLRILNGENKENNGCRWKWGSIMPFKIFHIGNFFLFSSSIHNKWMEIINGSTLCRNHFNFINYPIYNCFWLSLFFWLKDWRLIFRRKVTR